MIDVIQVGSLTWQDFNINRGRLRGYSTGGGEGIKIYLYVYLLNT